MQAWLSTSSPRAETTVERTSFQVVIWIASIAKHTHSWTLTGFGPPAKRLRRTSIWPRKAGRSASETCVDRS